MNIMTTCVVCLPSGVGNCCSFVWGGNCCSSQNWSFSHSAPRVSTPCLGNIWEIKDLTKIDKIEDLILGKLWKLKLIGLGLVTTVFDRPTPVIVQEDRFEYFSQETRQQVISFLIYCWRYVNLSTTGDMWTYLLLEICEQFGLLRKRWSASEGHHQCGETSKEISSLSKQKKYDPELQISILISPVDRYHYSIIEQSSPSYVQMKRWIWMVSAQNHKGLYC